VKGRLTAICSPSFLEAITFVQAGHRETALETDIPNLWLCDGSVFPTVGGVNPLLTIQAIACRTADRIKTLARRGEL
jgi:hypothetical protein